MDDFDQRVKDRAYRLWVEEGCPEGRADIHWEKARELVAIEQNQKHVTKGSARHQTAGEPVEPIEAVRNAGEFPTMTDQGEGEAAPKQRRAAAAARAPAKRKSPSAAAKPPKEGATKRR